LAAASAQAAQAVQAVQPGNAEAAAASSTAPDVRHFDTVEALLAALQAPAVILPAAASILVKGSRFMRMERVVDALVSRSEAPASSAAPTHRAEQASSHAPEAS
jgi:UDP-N-acetylmuramoyl-tripeptide--D-alanyl-D-alanine ligase